MSKPEVLYPAQGSRIVQDDSACILFGQPPEVLKGLLLNNITSFDTLVLTDIKEKDGSLQNNLEFPIYFFLFFARGLQEGRKLNLVGTGNDISQALRLMRYTLMGPTRADLTNGVQRQHSKKNGWRCPLPLRSKTATLNSIFGWPSCTFICNKLPKVFAMRRRLLSAPAWWGNANSTRSFSITSPNPQWPSSAIEVLWN